MTKQPRAALFYPPALRRGNPESFRGWYARGEQVRTLDGLIDWLRELWKLHEVFAADPAVAALLPT